ncbi:MAG: glutamate--tRNA ligase [Bdellovibrionota bacterium]
MNYKFRFAPSPTGFLHLGNLRTALYAYFAARHYKGKLVLRIEDTDRERLVPGSIKSLMNILDVMGIDFDEGPSVDELKQIGEYWDGASNYGGEFAPYIQSLRKEKYGKIAEKLVELGVAYRCDCTQEKLEEERKEREKKGVIGGGYSGYCRDRNVSKDTPHVIRFKMPKDCNLEIVDGVKGKLTWHEVPLADPVLLKSDGLPTYHLAVVVDDHEMGITHVLRGDEWISTTPIHLLIYRALNWEAPIFCHLPLILGKDKKKLSKRHGSTFVDTFLEEGYLPEALLNYITLIGWSSGDDREIFSKEELIESFTIDRINKASGIFDYDKLLWMNGVHIRNLSVKEYTKRVIPFIEKSGLVFDEEKFSIVACDVKERTKVLSDVPERVDFLFKKEIERNISDAFKKGIVKEKALEILNVCESFLSESSDFSIENAKALEEDIYARFTKLGYHIGGSFGVLRIAVTGKAVTPPLMDSIIALGKEETLKRVRDTKKEIEEIS